MSLQSELRTVFVIRRTLLVLALAPALSAYLAGAQAAYAAGTVTGTVFCDIDADGVQDGNEPGVAGV